MARSGEGLEALPKAEFFADIAIGYERGSLITLVTVNFSKCQEDFR